MVISDRLNINVRIWNLTWTCNERFITSTLSWPFNLQHCLAWFTVQIRISKYPYISIPWVTLKGWSVKLCNLDSSVLSLFSICLTWAARNTINPSCSISYALFSFFKPSKGQYRHTCPWKDCPFLRCTSRMEDERRCGNSKKHQEIKFGWIAKTNTPLEVCVPVIFQ